MDSIMQGTTPELTITIKKTDFLLTDVEKIELVVQNGNNLTTYTEAELLLDSEANTVTLAFTEEETAALSRKYQVLVQARFWLTGGVVVGIKKISFQVADMLGVGD